jgi:hypothetical protein
MMKDPVTRKLENVMGPVEGLRLVQSVCRQAGISSLEDPQQRLQFGCVLMQRGGLLEAIGRSIKIQAILHGATDN